MSKKNKKPKTPPKPDVPFAMATLEIAIQNVKASRILYENGFYPEAAFFLQQGIEKGCKSFGFYYGIIRKSDVFDPDFRHKGMAVYEITLRQLQTIISDMRRKISLIKECENNLDNKNLYFDDIETDIIDAQQKLQFYSSNANNYFQISEEELFEVITKIKEIDEAVKIIDKNLQDELLSIEITEYMKQKAMEIIQSVIHTSAIDKGFFQKLNRETLLTILHFTSMGLCTMGPLLQLAIITYPHERRSRYADVGIPSEIYTNKFPLILHFIELSDISERILNQLQNVYDYLPPPGGSQI